MRKNDLGEVHTLSVKRIVFSDGLPGFRISKTAANKLEVFIDVKEGPDDSLVLIDAGRSRFESKGIMGFTLVKERVLEGTLSWDVARELELEFKRIITQGKLVSKDKGLSNQNANGLNVGVVSRR